MRKIPPLASVRVFEAAARHRNFTQAAAELGMTQAAVSYQIKFLEERLQVKLFIRHKGSLSLTDVATRIVPQISKSFDTLEQAFRQLSFEDSKVLTISTTESFATHWLAPRIGSFQVLQPQIAVRMIAEHRHVDLTIGESDVAIRHGRGIWPDMQSRFLMRVVLQPFACSEFIERNGIRFGNSDLISLPRLSPDDIWWQLWLRGNDREFKLSPNNAGIRMDSQAMEANAAMAGHGIAILNSLMWEKEVQNGHLVPVGPGVIAEDSYWLVYPETRKNSAKIRNFSEWLEGQISLAKASSPKPYFDPPIEARGNADFKDEWTNTRAVTEN